jgi:hypothetical protein
LKKIKQIASQYFELGSWLLALLYLYSIDPAANGHLQLCVFKWLGFSSCPGCGLGHAISWLLHGQLHRSWQEHPFGVVALPVLIHRIYILLKNNSNLIAHAQRSQQHHP